MAASAAAAPGRLAGQRRAMRRRRAADVVEALAWLAASVPGRYHLPAIHNANGQAALA